MSTFAQMQKELHETRCQRTILAHIVDYLEAEFRPPLGSKPRQYLLDEVHQAVPEEAFEAVVVKLLDEVKTLDAHILTILESALTSPTTTEKGAS